MRTCRDCGGQTQGAVLCESCQAVEVALTPRSVPAITPGRVPPTAPPHAHVTFPLLPPAREPEPGGTRAVWIASVVAVLVLVGALAVGWRALAR